MKFYFIGFILLLFSASRVYGQATFQSAGTGNWNSSGSWTLISGSDPNNRPDADDNVIIMPGHTITANRNEECNNLEFRGGTLSYSGNRTVTINGNLSVTANSSVSGFSASQFFNVSGNASVNTGVSFSIPSITMTITGSTTVNGSMTVAGNSRTRNFGNVTINASGTLALTGGNTYNFNGNLTNNGTFTANDFNQIFNFNSSSGAISGSNLISLFTANFNSPANYTNTGNLQIRNQMSGTGSFTNGNGGQLELQNGGPFTVSTFNASAAVNTVTYTGNGSPTAFPGTYYNLVINKSSGTLGFSGSPNISNDLTIQNGILDVGAVTLTVGNNLNLQGGEFTPNNASAVVNIGGNLNVSNGEYDQNNGDVNITGNINVTGGNFFLDGGSSTIDASTLSVQNATLNLTQGTITTSGDFDMETGSSLIADGATFNLGAFNLNAGSANFTAGSLNATSIYVGSGNELFINAVNLSSSGTTELDGTMTFNSGTGTKSVGSILVNAGGNWNVTQPANITVSGNITNNGTFTGSPTYGTSVYTLTSASGIIGGSNPITIRDVLINSPASYTNQVNLTISQSLTGTGSFTNANGASLELQGAGPFSVSSFDASAPVNTVTYSGGSSPALNSGSYYNLIINKSSGTITINSTTNVANNLTVSDGILAIGATTLNVTNNVLLEDGELSPNNASAFMDVGGDLIITGGEYDHNNGDVNVTGDIIVTGGTFFLNGVSSTIDADNISLQDISLTLSEGTITTTGDFDLETGSALTANGATLNVGGGFNHNAGTANFSGGSLSAGSIYVGTGNNLTIGGINVTSTGTTELDGTITFNNATGTKSLGSILVNASGSWIVSQPENFSISGDITNNGTFTGDPGYGTSTYTLTSTSGTLGGSNTLSLRDIQINSPASYSNEGTLVVANTFTGSGTFINAENSTLTYAGNNSSGTNFTISNFTASATGNTVIYAGTTYSQQWRQTTSANNDYYNVTVNMGTGGYQRLQLVADVRVNGTLTITEASPLLNSFDLELAPDAIITGGDASSWIRINGSGVVRQYYNAVGGTTFYPIGDNSNYSPITSFTVNSATLGADPYVEFDVVDANHPNRNTNNLAQGGNDDGTAATAYISRYWTLTGNDMSNPNYDVSYQYIDGDVTGTEANMIAALYGQPPGETFFDWKETGTVNATNNTATINNGNYWGDLYAMDNNMDRLPVELLSFTGQATDNSVMLKWSTASEVNNSYFSVERSNDGLNFKEITVVQGAGTTNSLKNYSFEDKYPIKGRLYYRLKQVDFNGQFDYSPVVSVQVDIDQRPFSMSLFPNPALPSEVVMLKIKHYELNGSTAFIKIVNQMGLEVWSSEKSIQKGEPIQLPSLPRGTYLVHVFTNQQKLIGKLMVS